MTLKGLSLVLVNIVRVVVSSVSLVLSSVSSFVSYEFTDSYCIVVKLLVTFVAHAQFVAPAVLDVARNVVPV